MKRTGEELIEKLSLSAKLQLIHEYEEFERTGCIGDCELRTLAQTLPSGQNNVILVMNMIAIECYRDLANRWISQNCIL